MDRGLQLKDEATGQTYPLDQEAMVLGRTSPGYPVDPGFVHIDNDTVSRRHAELAWSPAGFLLVNLSTTNPIRINGHQLESCVLKAGDRLELVECVLQLVSTRITLQARPALRVRFGEQVFPISGYTVAIGGPGGKAERWYDQEILIDGLEPQSLRLAWKDIAGRYELSYSGRATRPVQITRLKGELEWLALLPTDRPGGVRPGDRIRVGETEFQLF